MNLLSSSDSSSFPKKYSGLLHVTAGSLLKGFSNVDDTHRQYATTHNFLFRLSNLSISNQLLENKSSLGNFQNYLFCRKNFYYLQENDPTRKHKRLTEVSTICTMQNCIFSLIHLKFCSNASTSLKKTKKWIFRWLVSQSRLMSLLNFHVLFLYHHLSLWQVHGFSCISPNRINSRKGFYRRGQDRKPELGSLQLPGRRLQPGKCQPLPQATIERMRGQGVQWKTQAGHLEEFLYEKGC